MSASFWRDRPTLVTGATGLLGGWLTRDLADAGADVVCVVRDWVPRSELLSTSLLQRVRLVRGDVRDQALIERVLGEYEVDDFGLDAELNERVFLPLLRMPYKNWWRVEQRGTEHIPTEGPALLVANHSGQLPWDGAMVMMSVLSEHPAQRLVRSLYASWFPTLPFFSALFEKMGQVLATVENGTRLLEQDELVAVYPEGYKGVGKLYKDRYKPKST